MAASVTTPEKPTQKASAAADLTWTPDKTEQRPLVRRAEGKAAVVLSLKDVRRAALGLTQANKGPVAVLEESELESVSRDWNSYAAARTDASSSSPLPFDIEAVVRSANDIVTSTFSV